MGISVKMCLRKNRQYRVLHRQYRVKKQKVRNSLANIKFRKEEREEFLHVLETGISLQARERITVEQMSII